MVVSSHSVQLVWWGCPFNPLYRHFVAGDLRTAQFSPHRSAAMFHPQPPALSRANLGWRSFRVSDTLIAQSSNSKMFACRMSNLAVTGDSPAPMMYCQGCISQVDDRTHASRGTFHFHSFQGSVFSGNHQKPGIKTDLFFLEKKDG